MNELEILEQYLPTLLGFIGITGGLSGIIISGFYIIKKVAGFIVELKNDPKWIELKEQNKELKEKFEIVSASNMELKNQIKRLADKLEKVCDEYDDVQNG